MEQIDIPQERRYCSKLGFSVLAIMLWSILWQFGLYWLHGPCAPSLKAVLQNAGMFLLIVACFVQTVFNYL